VIGRRTWFGIYLAVLLVLAAMVLGSFELLSEGYERATLVDQMQSKAWKPFVYRAFVPLALRAIKAPIPESTLMGINSWAATQMRTNTPFLDLLLTKCIWYASIVLFAFAFIYLARAFYVVNTLYLHVLSLLAVAGLRVFFCYHSYIYDPTHVLLFTLCLALMARGKWLPYLLVFAAASINKETSILLTATYFFAFRRSLPARIFRRQLVLQVLIFVLVKGALTLAFLDQRGAGLEYHLDHNMSLAPLSIAQFVAYVALGAAIAHEWTSKPLLLRWSLAMLLPLVLLTLFFGLLDEYRDYYEVYPAVLLLVGHSLARLLRVKPFRPRYTAADGH
jgi:hypothetical protein